MAALAPLAVSEALPRGRWRYAAVWPTYVWLFKVAWEIPYDRPDRLGRRLRVRGNVRLDSLLGGGEPPSVRLQRALRDPPRVTLLDIVLTAAYYGLWLTPHVVVMWILVRHEGSFPRAAGRLSGVYHLATVGYWIRPSAPPWWASEVEGEMDGAVQRVAREVELALLERLRRAGGDERRAQGGGDDWRATGNPWASMPSDHFGAACMTAMILAEFGATAGAAGWAYVVVIGFAVVYLGRALRRRPHRLARPRRGRPARRARSDSSATPRARDPQALEPPPPAGSLFPLLPRFRGRGPECYEVAER